MPKLSENQEEKKTFNARLDPVTAKMLAALQKYEALQPSELFRVIVREAIEKRGIKIKR